MSGGVSVGSTTQRPWTLRGGRSTIQFCGAKGCLEHLRYSKEIYTLRIRARTNGKGCKEVGSDPKIGQHMESLLVRVGLTSRPREEVQRAVASPVAGPTSRTLVTVQETKWNLFSRRFSQGGVSKAVELVQASSLDSSLRCDLHRIYTYTPS